MKVIGITGGVGSGKSEVLKFLASRERAVICQSDEVAKTLQRKGTACFEKIVEHYGFQFGHHQDAMQIRRRVHVRHPEYIDSFDYGYNL